MTWHLHPPTTAHAVFEGLGKKTRVRGAVPDFTYSEARLLLPGWVPRGQGGSVQQEEPPAFVVREKKAAREESSRGEE